MKTGEVLIYGTIIYLLYKLYQNTKPHGDDSNMLITKSINLPKFATVTPTYWNKKQIQPTPAEVLSPEQLTYYKSKGKAISKQIYTC
jgi:hypothetical protein